MTEHLRSIVGIGLLILVAMIFLLLAFIPGLRTDGTFKDLALLLVGGAGFGAVVAWLFGGSKAASERSEVIADQARALAAAAPHAVQPVDVVNGADAPVPVKEDPADQPKA